MHFLPQTLKPDYGPGRYNSCPTEHPLLTSNHYKWFSRGWKAKKNLQNNTVQQGCRVGGKMSDSDLYKMSDSLT